RHRPKRQSRLRLQPHHRTAGRVGSFARGPAYPASTPRTKTPATVRITRQIPRPLAPAPRYNRYMVTAERRKSIALFIALGAGLILVTLLLYIGWVLLNWRTGLLLFLGVLLLACIIGGVVLNTIFLVREIRRNEQHNAFINAVTHELKTPVASIRLYLQTLQSRPVDDA